MSFKNDGSDDELNPRDLVFILAIAGRLDAQSRLLAQKLDKDRSIYYTYSVLDSLSSSYSLFKYFFDVFGSNNDSDYLHDIMMSPGGIIGITAETLFLVSFSFLAFHYDSEKEDVLKKWIATAWPYFRDAIKGLKNAYKGWRSIITVMNALGNGADLKHLIAPVGFALGVFAAANRFWYRSMIEDRKNMMGANAALLLKIAELPSLTEEESETYLSQIKYQSLESRIYSFVAATTGGLIDGLYLYFGVVGLTALSYPVLATIVSLSVFYTLACVVTRVYEEYDFQLKLFITQTKCELALITKELQTTYGQLCALKEKTGLDQVELFELNRLETDLCYLIDQFEKNRDLLHKQSNRSTFSSVLLGIKNGLYAYGAFTSAIFMVVPILTFSGVVFPPVLLVSLVSLGMVFMLSFIIHSLVTNHEHENEQEKIEDRAYKQLLDMKRDIELNRQDAVLIESDSLHEALKDGLTVRAAPQFFLQEWFEVGRSLFSGLVKGQKFVDFALSPMQEMDDQGHYHDTPIMYVLGLISALGFGITLGLRALARGLGRRALGDVDLTKAIKDTQDIDAEEDLLIDDFSSEGISYENELASNSLAYSLYTSEDHECRQDEVTNFEVARVQDTISSYLYEEPPEENQEQSVVRKAAVRDALQFHGFFRETTQPSPSPTSSSSVSLDEDDDLSIFTLPSPSHTTQGLGYSHCTF